jgi:hypothetical protein
MDYLEKNYRNKEEIDTTSRIMTQRIAAQYNRIVHDEAWISTNSEGVQSLSSVADRLDSSLNTLKNYYQEQSSSVQNLINAEDRLRASFASEQKVIATLCSAQATLRAQLVDPTEIRAHHTEIEQLKSEIAWLKEQASLVLSTIEIPWIPRAFRKVARWSNNVSFPQWGDNSKNPDHFFNFPDGEWETAAGARMVKKDCSVLLHFPPVYQVTSGTEFTDWNMEDIGGWLEDNLKQLVEQIGAENLSIVTGPSWSNFGGWLGWCFHNFEADYIEPGRDLHPAGEYYQWEAPLPKTLDQVVSSTSGGAADTQLHAAFTESNVVASTDVTINNPPPEWLSMALRLASPWMIGRMLNAIGGEIVDQFDITDDTIKGGIDWLTNALTGVSTTALERILAKSTVPNEVVITDGTVHRRFTHYADSDVSFSGSQGDLSVEIFVEPSDRWWQSVFSDTVNVVMNVIMVTKDMESLEPNVSPKPDAVNASYSAHIPASTDLYVGTTNIYTAP